MKKSIICMIVSIMLILSFSIVSSAAYLGDINADGKITASDARSILRVSAKLDKIDNEKMVFADANADGRITASDARTVLRMSAKLEKLQELTTKAPETQLTTEIVTSEMTTVESTTEELSKEEPTTEEPTAEEPTTEEPTTEEPTTEEPTTEEPTTEEPTTEEPTTEEPTTEEPTTEEPTTEEPTTEEPTTEEPTTEEPTTEEPTTEEPTTEEPTTEEPTTEEPTTEEPTTEEPTTEEPTTEEPTTEEPTTEEPTTEEPTTEEPTTEEPTTDEPTTEPEEDVSYPDAIEAFLSGRYYISGKKGLGQKLKIAVSGSDTEMAVMSGDAQISVLKKSGKTFVKAISSAGKKYYVRYTELMEELFGSDFTELTSCFDFSSYSDKGEPVVNSIVDDDVVYDVFSFENEGSVLKFYFTDGKAVKIENIPSDGEEVISFAVEEMSGKIPSDMLKIKGFTATGIENIPYVVPEFVSDPSAVQPSVKTYPVALKVFLGGKYHMTGTLYDCDAHSFGYTYDGTDKSVLIDGLSYFSRSGIRYIRNENEKLFVQVNDEQLSEYGIDFNSILDENTFLLEGKTECTAFEKSTYDGLSCDIYTLRDGNGNTMRFTVVFERLAKIAVLDADGNEVKYVVVDEFDDDIPDSILTLVGYRRSDFASITDFD